MSRRTALWLLLLGVLLGVGLRSYQLTARSLWFDEAFSWRLIQFPLQEMIARDAADVHPPLYYIVLKSWSWVFGASLLALRSFSVTFAAATVAAAYLFAASAWRNRTVGLLAATLIAVSGWQIAFAWEARMYTLGTFLALISSWLLLRAVRAQRVGWWLGYAVVASAFAYIHYFALFSLVAHAVFVVGLIVVQTRGRVGEILQSRLLWHGVLALVIASTTYAPWLPVFVSQHQQVQAAYWVPDVGGWSVPDTFYRFFIPTAQIPSHTGIGALITLVPMAATVLGWVWLASGRQHRLKDADWLTALLGVVPFVLSIIVSFIGQSLYQDRFLVFANIFVLVGLAALVMRLRPLSVRPLIAGVVAGSLLITFAGFWRELDIPSKPGARAATQLVFEKRQEDEPILVGSPFVFFAVDHYSRQEHGGTAIPKLYFLTMDVLHFSGGPILTPKDIVGPKFFDSFAGNTVWVVDTSGFGAVSAQLPSGWQQTEQYTFPEVFPYQGEVYARKYQQVSRLPPPLAGSRPEAG